MAEENFGGDIYSKTETMTDDNATRFETYHKWLRDIILLVEDNAMLLGSEGNEVYPVAKGESIGFVQADICSLYFKNADAGKNGKISILGVTD